MKTKGEFTIVIRGSTERTGKVPLSSWSGFQYLMQRLVTGDPVAESEFPHYGLAVEVLPGQVLDPWDHGVSPSCRHNWTEITTRNDRARRWKCTNCDAELSKGR
jgi:hypothetical protein